MRDRSLPVDAAPRAIALDYPDSSFAREIATLPPLSLRAILRPVFRRIWPALTLVMVGIIGTFLYLLCSSPTYLAVSKVMVHVGREKLSSIEVGNSSKSNFMFNERPENVNDEIEIIQSPSVLERSLPALRANLPRAVEQPPSGPLTFLQRVKYAWRTARRAIGDAASWTLQTLKEPLYAIGFSQRLSPEAALRQKLANALGVVAIKETNVFAVSFGWSDPVFAAFALNTILDVYEQEHLRIQANLAGAVNFYREQETRAHAELAKVTRELDSYAKSRGTSDPVTDKQLVQTRIVNLERDLTNAAISSRQTRERIAALRGSAGGAWPATPGVPQESQSALADLDARYAQLTSTRSKLSTEWKPDSALIRDVDAQITRLRSQKRRALAAYLHDRLGIEQQAEAAIHARLASSRAELNRLREIENGFLALQGRRDQLLTQMKEYQRITEQVMLQRALNANQISSVSILNRASPPALPIWPRKSLIMGLAAFFAVLAAAAYVMVAQFFDQTVSTEEDLERVLGLPVLGRVPRVRAT